MRPSTWQPPVETSAAEDKIIKRIKLAKLFLFLRRHRHQIFTSEFQIEAELVAGSSLKAALDLDWDDPTSREQALRQVIEALERVEQWVAAHPELITEGSVAPDCLEAARQVRAQDVQTNEAGNPALIKGVAKDRRISIEDPEMRHGRKSRSLQVNGYKRHVCRDLDSELVVAVGINRANPPEASVVEGIKRDQTARDQP